MLAGYAHRYTQRYTHRYTHLLVVRKADVLTDVLTDILPANTHRSLPRTDTCGSIAADPDRPQGLAAVTGKEITQEPAQSRRAGGSTHLTTSSMPHTRMGAYV